MNLSKENIQFIDNYLDNSDVVYADIRMEMVDHVASAIEAKMDAGDTCDFYNVFKEYMVANKRRLLDNNKQFLKSEDRKIIKLILINLAKPMPLLVFVLSFTGFYLVYNHFEYETFRALFLAIPLFGFIGFALLYFIYTKYYKLNRFSVVERVMFPFLIIYHLFIFSSNISIFAKDNNQVFWVIGIGSLTLTLLYVLIRVTIQLTKSYAQKFKNLV